MEHLNQEQAEILLVLRKMLMLPSGYEKIIFYNTNTKVYTFCESNKAEEDEVVRKDAPLQPSCSAVRAIEERKICVTTHTQDRLTVIDIAFPIVAAGGVIGTVGFIKHRHLLAEIIEIIQDLEAIVRSMASSVWELTASASVLSEQSDEMLIYLREVLKNFVKMEEIVRIILKLSSDTELIGFNAMIQASKAGNHGSTFGVVANEVMKLARNSGDSLAEIKNSIDSVKSIVSKILEYFTELNAMIQEQTAATEDVQKISDELRVSGETIIRYFDRFSELPVNVRKIAKRYS
ncbi:MAG: hypothetical protein JL50_04765 [Peptococcaceae bacterium BICA1-7]|nr:MAG: hypothetical protein JL50_04765 [Peptococcaceae bacterium BICA1-7]HBV95935.1 hypothetical protein [Desulfotomaculum sp.]